MGSTILWGYADAGSQELNTSYWRVFFPANTLKTAGHDCRVHHIGALFSENKSEEIRKDIDEAEVIVLERLLLKDFHDTITSWRKSGKRVYTSFDDNYALIPPGLSSRAWRGGKRQLTGADDVLAKHGLEQTGDLVAILNEFRQGLRLVDGALVPSEVLQDDYRPYCEKIWYVPNFPFLPLWKNVRPKPQGSNIVIGWGGSSGHSVSWTRSAISPALGNICRRYPRATLDITGGGQDVADLLKKCGVRFNMHGWQSFETWPNTVASWTIYVAPLAGEYDRRRSFLKSEEAALAGIPWVASDLGVYTHARGGILVKNRPTDWAKAISVIINDNQAREKLVSEGREWVMDLASKCIPTYERVLGI